MRCNSNIDNLYVEFDVIDVDENDSLESLRDKMIFESMRAEAARRNLGVSYIIMNVCHCAVAACLIVAVLVCGARFFW